MAIGGQKGRVKVILPLLQPSRRQNDDVHAPSRPALSSGCAATVCFPLWNREGNGGFHRRDIVENRVTNYLLARSRG